MLPLSARDGHVQFRLLGGVRMLAAAAARLGGIAMWAETDVPPAYEYRAMERLHAITKEIAGGADLPGPERFAWRERYCADLRSRTLHGPEDCVTIPPEHRLWLWRADVPDAIACLVPALT